MTKKKGAANFFVWILMGLLLLGLAGFGATNLSGTIRTVGSVGDQLISVEDYMRELDREIRAVEQQTGQNLTMEQARALGLDRNVLTQLVTLAALDNETDRIGISIGDKVLRQELYQISSFQGLDGKFDPETYRFALEQVGVSAAEFEEDIRAESARTLTQGAVLAGVKMPSTLPDTLLTFVGARRSFTWAAMDPAQFTPENPDLNTLKSFHTDNPDQFRLPESRKITYAWLTPEMILDQVEVDETALKELYDQRADRYQVPERRLIERLAFADEAAANDAKAQLEVGGTSFDVLVTDRGLSLADVDMGDVARDGLDTAAVDGVFAAEIGDVVGPFPTNLGPALFRINGILSAQNTSLEEARAELVTELAADRARRVIETQSQDIDDLLAGGATLEELPDETDMQLGTLDWTANSAEGIAAYDAFRSAAAQITADDFPAIAFLEDGGIFAMRLDEILPERPEPFAQDGSNVIDKWRAAEVARLMQDSANASAETIRASGEFAGEGLSVRVENGLTRTAYIEGLPITAMLEIFEMEKGDVTVISDGDQVAIVQLNDTLPPEETPATEAMREALTAASDRDLAQALFTAYAINAQTRARPRIDDRAIAAAQNSFQ